MNPLNVIGAVALAGSIYCLFNGPKPEAVGATAALSASEWNLASGPTSDAGILTAAVDAALAAQALPAANVTPHAASLAPWSSVPWSDEVVGAPLTVAFTTPEPFTLAILAGVGVAVAYRRTRAASTSSQT